MSISNNLPTTPSNMSLPNVVININTSGLGGVPSSDWGIMGLCLTGAAVAGKLVLDNPYYIYNLDGAKALGILDTGDNAFAYRQIKEFYDTAGDGVKLWIIVSDNATYTIADLVDKSADTCPAKILLDAAGGEIKVLGVCWHESTGYSPSIVTGLDADVITAITNAQVLAADYLAKVMPVVVLIEGISYDGDSGTLLDLRTKTAPRVGVVLCSSVKDDFSASVGLVIGRLAAIPVMRSIGRVKDGELPVTAMFMAGESLESQLDDLGTIHGKGYITARKFPRKAGYYFNDDPTAVAVTNDLCQISRVRTIDKAVVIAYDSYVEEINDEVKINADGTMDAAILKSLQAKIERNIGLQMADEISGLTATIDPLQNILSTNKLAVVIRIIPFGVMKEITVDLGFTNPTLTT